MSTNRCRRSRNTNWRLVVLIGMENWKSPYGYNKQPFRFPIYQSGGGGLVRNRLLGLVPDHINV